VSYFTGQELSILLCRRWREWLAEHNGVANEEAVKETALTEVPYQDQIRELTLNEICEVAGGATADPGRDFLNDGAQADINVGGRGASHVIRSRPKIDPDRKAHGRRRRRRLGRK
jgi:hypothetical protein